MEQQLQPKAALYMLKGLFGSESFLEEWDGEHLFAKSCGDSKCFGTVFLDIYENIFKEGTGYKHCFVKLPPFPSFAEFDVWAEIHWLYLFVRKCRSNSYSCAQFWMHVHNFYGCA